MRVRTITAAIAVAATVSSAPGAAIASAASPQVGYVATGGVSAVHTAAVSAAAKWHFVGVFPAKQACQVAGRYYMRVGYAKGYKCKKILVGPLHRLYVLR
ncbi:hypothetical protein GCM10017673_45020 [Streptosporangium violaceochromogenes]|nr:hypothetical protein GCM10017673_45020 [Streptosporangium violaceochromogenes]